MLHSTFSVASIFVLIFSISAPARADANRLEDQLSGFREANRSVTNLLENSNLARECRDLRAADGGNLTEDLHRAGVAAIAERSPIRGLDGMVMLGDDTMSNVNQILYLNRRALEQFNMLELVSRRATAPGECASSLRTVARRTHFLLGARQHLESMGRYVQRQFENENVNYFRSGRCQGFTNFRRELRQAVTRQQQLLNEIDRGAAEMVRNRCPQQSQPAPTSP